MDKYPRLNSVVVLEHGQDIVRVYNALVMAVEAGEGKERDHYQSIIERLFLESP